MFFCFFQGEPKIELSVKRDGPISKHPDLAVTGYQHPRASLEELLGFDLFDNAYELLLPPADRERVLRADSVVLVGARVNDTANLNLLWQANAYIRAAAFGGAFLCLDIPARRWWRDEELKARKPNRPFIVEEHIGVNTIFDEDPPFSRTVGMEKFARPDLVIPNISNQPGVVMAANTLINEIAHRMGEGKAYNEASLVRLHFSSGPVEACFVKTTPAEDDFFGTSGALVLVDPGPGLSPQELKRQGCPRALALVRQHREQAGLDAQAEVEASAPQGPEIQIHAQGYQEPDQPNVVPAGGPKFSHLMDEALKLMEGMLGQLNEALKVTRGRAWGVYDSGADRQARLRLEGIVGGSNSGPSAHRSDRKTLMGVALARVAIDCLGMSTDLDGLSDSERRLYQSFFTFNETQEFGPCFGVETLGEKLPAQVAAGFWLYFGYHGRLPNEPQTVETCASLGVLFGMALDESFGSGPQKRETSLNHLTVLFAGYWDGVYKTRSKQLEKYLRVPRASVLSKLKGGDAPEPSQQACLDGFTTLAIFTEKVTEEIQVLPSAQETVLLTYGTQEVELSLFRAMFGALGAYVLCRMKGVSFPTEGVHPRVLTVYLGALAFEQSDPLDPALTIPSDTDRYAVLAALALLTFIGGEEIEPEAYTLVGDLAATLSHAAKRVAYIAGLL